jgi:hypothetical protein
MTSSGLLFRRAYREPQITDFSAFGSDSWEFESWELARGWETQLTPDKEELEVTPGKR